ncbi:MAG TPA: nucleotide exchange factor GrpE [Desulfotomaculum sp.]|nr:nucleotide exchange factor GrpE [Desulfotomaculum sp.]
MEDIPGGETKVASERDGSMDAPEEDAVEACQDRAVTDQPGSGESPGEADGDSLARQLDQERAKAEDYFNRLARMQADFDNYRRRVAREREELVKYAGEQIITALLPVLDNLERALSLRHDDVDKVYEGIEMISRQIRDVLNSEGLEAVPAVGAQFNPEIHEAVMREEGGEHPENTVIEELRKGYSLRGKTIRAAMVKVAT